MALRSTWLWCGLAGAMTLACSSDNSAKSSEDGGAGTSGSSSGGSTSGNSSGGSKSSSSGGSTSGNTGGTSSGTGGRTGRGGRNSAGGGSQTGGASSNGGASTSGGATGSGGSTGNSDTPWLHTKGNKIYTTSNGADAVWIGRGVNMDDIYLCGYNFDLSQPNAEKTVTNIATNLIAQWKPNFIRIQLGMASYQTAVSFLSNPAQYKTPMVNVINAIGTHPGVYVLVTLRSDASMIGQDQGDGDPEATGLPSDATTTPNKSKFPTGTDAVYQALVDTFANSSFVMFGISNEPGGNLLANSKIQAAMDHAVSVIRAEEDKLGTPHHVVSVQGQGWTSDISFYGSKPLTEDNVVYEVHGYPPETKAYTYSNIPVIIGEYGGVSSSFFTDLESKQISSLAFTFSPYSNCDPDLLNVNNSDSMFSPTSWGNTVKQYLTSHAQ